MLGRDGKMQPGFMIFQISPRCSVMLVGRLSWRPASFQKPTRWNFTRAVTLGVVFGT